VEKAPLCLISWCIVFSCAFLTGCSAHKADNAGYGDALFVNNALLSDNNDGADSPAYGRSYGEQHFSPLTQVNDETVGKLGLVWYMDLEPGNANTQPVEVGGVLYFSYGLSVVRAIDAKTGKLLWTYDSKTGERASAKLRQGWGIRGIAYWDGKVYTGTGDGRLIAINAKTGREVWAVDTVDPADGLYITGAPRVFDGKIIIGNGGGDSASIRGYVTTYDAETGKLLWRFFTVPGDPSKGFEDKTQEMAAKTWHGEWWKYGGGGNDWNSFTYDAQSNTILIGTGNGAPYNYKVRSAGKGDNLFLSSIVALNADTGAYKWHYQVTPADDWDYDACLDMALADMKIGGQIRKVVVTAQKNGFVYLIDRTNGKLISAGQFAKVTWATKIDIATGRPVTVASAHFPNGKPFELWPSMRGAHSVMPMSFSPKTGLAYIPKLESGVIYSDQGITAANWKRTPGNADDEALNIRFDVKNSLQNTSSLLAWDPLTQKKAWEVKTIGGWNGGTMVTAGNLVFQGQLNGRLSAYSADKGKELWHFDAQNAVLSAPITFKFDGNQYVTVIVGMGSSPIGIASALGGLTFDYRTQKRRILTFMLNGKAVLPAAEPPFKIKSIDDPGYRAHDALAGQGAVVFGRRCTICHGVDAVAAGGAPDLRASAVPQDKDSFAQIVSGGGLVTSGMPKFDNLSALELESVRQYIRSRADDLRSGKQSNKPSMLK
jgi:quinohemoprotein ethanol dehydrogenase